MATDTRVRLLRRLKNEDARWRSTEAKRTLLGRSYWRFRKFVGNCQILAVIPCVLGLLLWIVWGLLRFCVWLEEITSSPIVHPMFLPIGDLISTYVPWQVVAIVSLFALSAVSGAHFDMLGATIAAETSRDDGSHSDAKLRWAWLGMIVSRYVLNTIHAVVAFLIAVSLLFIVGAAVVSDPVVSLLVIIVALLVVLVVQQSRRGQG